jgi:phosphoglycolate phosphatase-like HAD superfamily hydrolase
MNPYPELLEALRRHSGEVEFALATAKDGASVSELIARYQVADLLGPDRVFDKRAGRDKRAHLRRVRERFDVEFSQISFIDDKVNHLIPVKELGVRCFLASWGYNGPREHALAQDRGIGVCGLAQLESLVFS